MDKLKVENWKTIKGFPFYKISDTGRVKSIDRIIVNSNGFKSRKKGILLRQHANRKGYLMCSVYDENRKKKSFSVHRLVAMHFVDGQKEDLQVNHIDGNKLNNNKSNLEWCTLKENIRHAWANGLCENTRERSRVNGNFRNKGKLSKSNRVKKVINTETGEITVCLKELCLNNGFSYNQMQKKLRGERKNNTPYKYYYDS